jgi:DNA (cytosine-5)-methyltransferase 1
MSKSPLRVVELFAGVGGFKIALEGYPKREESNFEIVWSNQFEPRTKKQHANLVYKNRWPKAHHSEEDIETIVENDIDAIPEHDLLVGGFPCQDFSIANRSHNKGLEGTKGKLWWSIYKILKKKRPNYILLENVDRLLRSPSKQIGRDFAVILTCLNELGYAVEWRVINAADYGFPQRRRRVFIIGYKKGSKLYSKIKKTETLDWLTKSGITAKAFPVKSHGKLKLGMLPDTIEDALQTFSNKDAVFDKAGLLIDGVYCTYKVTPDFKGKHITLSDVLLDKNQIPESYFISEQDLPKWETVKGAKTIHRISKHTGKPYIYREGKVAFPDALDKPSRTLLTREGGSYICREKHVIYQNGRYRRLHPIELERLNGFPDDFTKSNGITDIQRAFFMGNALVVGVVKKLGKELARAVSC